jgi:endonuclease/exonuclease/phosphatase family metal-dependent hydrolase
MRRFFIVVLSIFLVSYRFQDDGKVTIRVMTYNIRHGEGIDGRIDIGRIAGVIMSANADLVALQEVDSGVARTNRIDIAAELAQLCGMNYIFGRNISFQGGGYGNAILSKFPIKEWRNRHLKMLRRGEQRGLLQAVISINGKELVFLNTHIDYRRDDIERVMNIEEFFHVIDSLYSGRPIIFCGDFNDVPESRVIRMMHRKFIDAWDRCGSGDGLTFSSDDPRVRIDYVFYSDTLRLKCIKARVLKTPASDHLPVLVEFEINF